MYSLAALLQTAEGTECAMPAWFTRSSCRPLLRRSAFGPFAAALCLIGWALSGCSEAETAASISADAGQGSDTAAKDVASGADTGTSLASCTGSALKPGFESKDIDCAFLAKCPTLGECYCGEKCPTSKVPRCDPSICPNNQPKCFCGEQCSADKKKCPQYICDPLDEKACAELDDCVFNTAKRPDWCGCQTMPPHKPDCWCNAAACSEPHPECSADKCVGKPAGKCIFVKGEEFDGCWCDRCGLLGETPKCFFVQCP